MIRANYLTAPSDIRIMLESAKLGRRIAATAPFADLIEQERSPGPATAARRRCWTISARPA